MEDEGQAGRIMDMLKEGEGGGDSSLLSSL